MALIQAATTVSPGAESAWVDVSGNTNVLVGATNVSGVQLNYRFDAAGLVYSQARGRDTPKLKDGPLVLVGADSIMVKNVSAHDIQFEVYTP